MTALTWSRPAGRHRRGRRRYVGSPAAAPLVSLAPAAPAWPWNAPTTVMPACAPAWPWNAPTTVMPTVRVAGAAPAALPVRRPVEPTPPAVDPWPWSPAGLGWSAVGIC